MYMHYDPAVDAMAIQFTRGKGKRVRMIVVRPGIHVDIDEEDRLLGLELLDASFHLPLADLMAMDRPEILLTLAEAAKESGHSPATLRVLINQGRLKGRKKGRDWIVTLYDLVNYLESRDARGPKTKLPRRTRDALKRKRDASAARR